MYIIIGGAGDAGLHLGRLLSNQGHEVVFIENDPSAADKAREIDALIVEGDVCDPQAMLEAGVRDCDYYIGLVKNDSANMISCSLANYYGCGTIARVNDPALAKEGFSKRYVHVGVDVVLCPSLIASSQLSRVFAFPSRLKPIKKSGIGTYHANVDDEAPAHNQQIASLQLPKGVTIASVFRGVKQILPSDSFTLQAEDELCFLFDQRIQVEEVNKIEYILGSEVQPYTEINNVLIAGITEVGLTLAHQLMQSDISVSIIDLSRRRTEEAAERLPDASVIHADPLGHGVLREEGIDKFDLLFAMGSSLERNIFTSILAKRFNVPYAIALIDRIDLKESMEDTLVDSVVVPNLLMVNAISNILQEGTHWRGSRRKRPIRLSTIQTKDIILKEIKVTKKVRCLHKKISDFSPEIGDFLIAAVVKEEKGFIPDDDYVIKEGDTLLVLYHAPGIDTVKRWLIG